MNPDFPFSSKFNRLAFQDQIRNAQVKKPARDDTEYSYLKSHGIKYVVEAPGSNANNVRGIVRDIWQLDVEVEPLFQQYGNAPAVPDALQAFYLVSIPGVAFSDLVENPYDAAYGLLAGSKFRSVEPDLPYTQFLSASAAASVSGSGSSSTDQAWSLRNIRADKAWKIPAPPPGQTDGRGVSVAHLDTGWTHHDDLDRPNFDPGHRIKDFINPNGNAQDPLNYSGNPGHGTRTGSVIMSQGDVSPTPPGTLPPGQITGIARFTIYVPIRCIRSVAIIFNSNVARGVHHATAFSCDVISMSLGGLPMKALHAAIQRATANHLLVVCAAGNKVGITVWPANYKESIAVAASNSADKPWFWTSGGPAVDISAPGEDVWKAEPDGKRVAFSPGSGTSYATATLAGVAALWLAFYDKHRLVALANSRSQELQEVFREEIRSTARTPKSWNTLLYGAGIVDAERLLGSLATAIATRVPHAIPARNKSNDYVGSGMTAAKQLLRTVSGQLARDSTEAFEHELARIFLDEANDRDSTELVMTPEHLLDVLRRRGSRTLRSATGL